MIKKCEVFFLLHPVPSCWARHHCRRWCISLVWLTVHKFCYQFISVRCFFREMSGGKQEWIVRWLQRDLYFSYFFFLDVVLFRRFDTWNWSDFAEDIVNNDWINYFRFYITPHHIMLQLTSRRFALAPVFVFTSLNTFESRFLLCLQSLLRENKTYPLKRFQEFEITAAGYCRKSK